MVMFRLFEPKRPADYKELPRYERADYWHCMFRAVRILSDDVAEVIRFPDQRMRVMGAFLGLLTLGTMIAGVTNSYGSFGQYVDEVKDQYEYVFDFEASLKAQYQRRVERDQARRTEREFVEGMMNSKIHSYRFWNSLFFMHFVIWGMPLGCFALAAFWPRACPVRFDRKREIAYSWHKDRLYVADIGPRLGGYHARLTSELHGNKLFDMDTSTGALAITMQPVENLGEARLFQVGIYPVCHAHQSIDTQMFIQAFMSRHLFDEGRDEDWVTRKDWNAEWLAKLQRGRWFPHDPFRWLGKRTFGRKHGFDDAKTEAALMEYLTQPGTRSRENPSLM